MKLLNLTTTTIILCTITSNNLRSQLLSQDPINFPDYVRSIPFVDEHDNVYAITGRELYSVTSKGVENWKYVSDGESIYPESLCTTDDGRILFATYDEILHCIDNTGDSLWSYKMRDLSQRYRDGCHIVYSENDKVVVSSADSFIYVINGSGVLEWDKKFNFPFAYAPAVYQDSIIYCAPYRDTVFHAFDMDGNELWKFHPGYELFYKRTPVINSRGEVCMYGENSYSGAVKILDKNGIVKFETYEDLTSDPYFDEHDNLYFSYLNYGSYVKCFDSSGNTKWNFRVLGYVYSTPRLGPDGNLYFGSDGGNVFCLDATNGTEIYKFKFNGEIRYPVDFTSDGTIFCLVGHPAPFSVEGVLKSINNPQPPLWLVENKGFTKAPAISNNGIVVVCSTDSVYAYDENGQEIWNYSSEGDTLEVPVIFDNTVIITSRNKLTSLNLEGGALNWREQADGQYLDAPGVGLDKSIYIGSTDKNLYAYSASGEIKWSYTAEDQIVHSPAVTSLGDIVFTCQRGFLYSLDSSGNLNFKKELLAYNDTVPFISCHSPTIDGYGNIYIGTETDKDRTAALMSFSPTGNFNWARFFKFDNINSNLYPPTFDKDNNLYFTFVRSLRSFDIAGNWRYLDKENNIRWDVYLRGERLINNPTVDISGNVYIGSTTGSIYKSNSLCELTWVYCNADNEQLPSPVFIGESGKYFFTADSKLHHIVEPIVAPSEVYSKNRSDNGNTNLFYTKDITGINSISEEFGLQIYPNPVRDYLTISWKDMPYSLNLNIYDVQGKLIYQKQVDNGIPISVDQLNSGVYMIRFFNGDKFVQSSKIIID